MEAVGRTTLRRTEKEEAVRAAKAEIEEALKVVTEEEARVPGTSDGRVTGEIDHGHYGRCASPNRGDNKARSNPPGGKSDEFFGVPDGLTSCFFEQSFESDCHELPQLPQ